MQKKYAKKVCKKSMQKSMQKNYAKKVCKKIMQKKANWRRVGENENIFYNLISI